VVGSDLGSGAAAATGAREKFPAAFRRPGPAGIRGAMSPAPQRQQTRLLVAAVALAAAAGAAGLAGRPTADDSAGSIHACRQLRTGLLRVVGSASACRPGERPLVWNVRGKKGDPG